VIKLQQVQTWREILSQHLSNAAERKRITYELGVSYITLQRWIKGETTPRPDHLRRLLVVLPLGRELLLKQLQEEFPGLSPLEDEIPLFEEPIIPAEFFVRIIHSLATTPDELRFWTLSDLIVQQALKQLDPRRVGMAITVAQCMPPGPDGTIRSLREVLGQGTSPWESNLSHHLGFLGVESLAGYTAIAGHLMTNQNLKAEGNREPATRACGRQAQRRLLSCGPMPLQAACSSPVCWTATSHRSAAN
jgi:hypothetical protein